MFFLSPSKTFFQLLKVSSGLTPLVSESLTILRISLVSFEDTLVKGLEEEIENATKRQEDFLQAWKLMGRIFFNLWD